MMRLDLRVDALPWREVAVLAQAAEAAGIAGLQFTETVQAPWSSITAAALATENLELATAVAVAFPRSPMVMAQLAWELAGNTGGRFRLGLGSQVRAHVERRYGAAFDRPADRMRDYVHAVRACLSAFRGDAPLAHDGPFHRLSLLPAAARPPRHGFERVPIDIAAVGPRMVEIADEVADGIHVHPFHSEHYLRTRLLPALRRPLDLIVPVFVAAGDSPEERAPAVATARAQIAFYGSTRNYAFQFDDLGFTGTSARLHALQAGGDVAGMSAVIDDAMLNAFAVVCPWDEVADRLTSRYRDLASRIVVYGARQEDMGRWGEIARATRHVRSGAPSLTDS